MDHEVRTMGRWWWPFSHGPAQWSNLLQKKNPSLGKHVGPSLSVNRMWIKGNGPCTEKVNALLIFFWCMPEKGNFDEKIRKFKVNHSFVFSWLHLSCLLVFTLDFSKHGCNGGDLFALGMMHVFVHACAIRCGHSSIAFELGLWK